ncbi:hypothetical protein ACSBR2_022812 [Camellia fascicularis]
MLSLSLSEVVCLYFTCNSMEKALKTPPKTPIQSENTHSDSKCTPPQTHRTDQNSQNSGNGTGTMPNRLTVPKAFKYPERYTSPTDLMMSPVSKGLLARTRKPGTLLPPTKNQHPKIQDLSFQEVGLFANLKHQ